MPVHTQLLSTLLSTLSALSAFRHVPPLLPLVSHQPHQFAR
ncbi:hypothetical protein AB5J55_26215 [Streptomyces sp. R11]|uniref:Uncharacterized protein n=1 Tax=Streptomyces sp. R11 TaxID=3238625 RepID=A0AB39N3G7_9ACTN